MYGRSCPKQCLPIVRRRFSAEISPRTASDTALLCMSFHAGFWSFHDSAMIGRHAGGPSDDFGKIVKQFRLRLQLRLEATREVRDVIGSGKAEPRGELGQSGLYVAAAQPGCDRPCSMGIATLRKQGGV
jgi:hypothetical protein